MSKLNKNLPTETTETIAPIAPTETLIENEVVEETVNVLEKGINHVTTSIADILQAIKENKWYRPNYQRTPSHDDKKTVEILDTVLSKGYIGVIHVGGIVGEIDSQPLQILDGSSRIMDFEKFVNNKIAVSFEIVDSDGKTKNTKIMFKDLTEQEQTAFLNYQVHIMSICDSKDKLFQTFINLNSSVALSNIQKFKGDMSDNFNTCLMALNNSAIVKKSLTDKQMQKDEAVTVLVQIYANVFGVYNANNKTMVDSIKRKVLDIELFERCLFALSTNDKMSKYCLISVLSELYKLEITEDMILGNVVFTVDSSGANSGVKNAERLALAKEKIVIAIKVYKRLLKAKQAEELANQEPAMPAVIVVPLDKGQQNVDDINATLGL